LPIPDGNPPPLQSVLRPGADGVSEFRTPYPPLPVWNPPGQKRIGIQAGHWNYADSPDELANNRQNPGTSGGGKAEWQVNLDVAQRTVPLLEARGFVVDLLDGTPPIRYRAHAFVALHADGDVTQQLRGFKVGSPIFSATPAADKLLVDALWDEYGAVTGLQPQPDQVSRRMTGYYAFNSKRYQHAVAPGVPQAIIEMAFLTNPIDRAFLFDNADQCALGIANGIARFITGLNS
jgi:N-acetylmuramoyl-L-alanine amidase